MARISANGPGPSNNDVTKETTQLSKMGKLDSSNHPLEWAAWKAAG